MFWRKNTPSAPQTRLLYNIGKACLQHEGTVIVMQTSLLCTASKACLATKPRLPRHKTAAAPLLRPNENSGKELSVVK